MGMLAILFHGYHNPLIPLSAGFCIGALTTPYASGGSVSATTIING